jgi:hypothetical protein
MSEESIILQLKKDIECLRSHIHEQHRENVEITHTMRIYANTLEDCQKSKEDILLQLAEKKDECLFLREQQHRLIDLIVEHDKTIAQLHAQLSSRVMLSEAAQAFQGDKEQSKADISAISFVPERMPLCDSGKSEEIILRFRKLVHNELMRETVSNVEMTGLSPSEIHAFLINNTRFFKEYKVEELKAPPLLQLLKSFEEDCQKTRCGIAKFFRIDSPERLTDIDDEAFCNMIVKNTPMFRSKTEMESMLDAQILTNMQTISSRW